jgi:hypothetical protein
MDMIVVNESKSVQCAHCQGTTLCACSVLSEIDHKGGDKRLVPRCSRCGDGVARHSSVLGSLKDWRPPICGVCGGRGFLTL